MKEKNEGFATLLSETNTPEVEANIMQTANPRAVFEKGQWWFKAAGHIFAVVDTTEGLEFEQVS